MSEQPSAANEQELERLIGHKNGCPYLFFEQGECNCGDSATSCPECGADVTVRVVRASHSAGRFGVPGGKFTPDPVIVTCPNGHQAEYEAQRG